MFSFILIMFGIMLLGQVLRWIGEYNGLDMRTKEEVLADKVDYLERELKKKSIL